MNNYIFYFSGTGNSLSIAKQICARTQNTELISITNQIESGYEIEDADTIGFVLPVYLFGAPLIAEEFIKKLKIKRHKYLYVLFVHGGAPYSAVNNFKSKLNDAGLKVDAGFEIVSPDNYIAGNNPPNIEEARDILSKSKEELNKVIEEMKNTEDLSPTIVSGELMDRVNTVALHFKSYESLSLEECRELYVSCTQRLLDYINNHEEILPYLAIYPFTENEIEFAIAFNKPGTYERVDNKFIAYVSNINGKVCYRIDTGATDTNPLKTIHRESYSEALKIVKGEAKS